MNQAPSETERFSKSTKTIILIIILIIAFVEGFSTTGILPALPAISRHFGLKIGFVQMAIPIYFLGYLAQIPYGFFADCYGRKKVFIFCYVVFILGSALCILENNYFLFMIGRFLQGVGICSLYMYRPVLCDIFSEKQLKTVYSAFLGTIVVISALAPLICGYLNYFFGWKSIFITSFCLGVGMLTIILLLYPETLKERYKPHSLFDSFIKKHVLLLKNRVLIICALCSMMCLAGTYIMFAISPFLFQNVLGWSTHKYGFFSFCFLLAIAAGSMFNNILVKRFSFLKIMYGSVCALLLSGILTVVNYYLPFYSATTVLLIFVFCFFFGVIQPNAFLYSVKTIDKDVDAGTSFMFFSTIRTVGALLLFPISLLHTQSGIVMGALLFIVSFVILIFLITLKEKV